MNPQDFRNPPKTEESRSQDPRSRLTPEQMRILDERVAQDVLKWKRRLNTFNLIAIIGFIVFLIWWKLG